MSDFNVDPEISLDDAVNLLRNAHQQALNKFQQQGFVEPRPPMVMAANGVPIAFDGSLPPDLTTLNDNQLGSLLTLFTEYTNYVSSMAIRSEMELKALQETYDIVEAKLNALYLLDENSKRRTEAERKFAVRCDRRYVQIRSDLLQKETYVKILNGVVEASSKGYSAVSRRITQRGQEAERGNRGVNVGNLPAPGQPMFRR
jgi:hypothetical protein